MCVLFPPLFTTPPSKHTHIRPLRCTVLSSLMSSREPRGRYKLQGGTIKSYNVYYCETPTEIKVVLLAEPRCNLKPCLLARSSFPRRMDVCNGWVVFKLCSHKEKSSGTHETPVKLNHTWQPGSWIKPHLDSDQRLCVTTEMLFFVRQD